VFKVSVTIKFRRHVGVAEITIARGGQRLPPMVFDEAPLMEMPLKPLGRALVPAAERPMILS